MSEFQIQVNQSLVDKTLDNFSYDPLVVIDYSSDGVMTLDSFSPSVDELVENLEKDMEGYTKEALELVEEEFLLDGTLEEQSQEQPLFLSSLNGELVNPARLQSLLKLTEAEGVDMLAVQEQLEDAVSYAADMAAQYVMQFPTVFGPELVMEAEQVIQRESQHEFNAVVLGFGGFLKKVWGKVSKAASKIWKWVKKQVKRVVGFGQPELKELLIHQIGRPQVHLSNPITINGLNISVARLKVHIPYYIKWPWDPIRWRTIRITINNGFGAKADGVYQLNPEGLKIMVAARFTELKIKIRLIGIDFWVGLTTVANKILEKKSFEIYDVGALAKPMQVKGLEYKVSSLVPTGLKDGLRLDVGIDVSKKTN